MRLDVAMDDADLVDRVQRHEQLHAVPPQLRLVHVPVALLVGSNDVGKRTCKWVEAHIFSLGRVTGGLAGSFEAAGGAA